MPSGHFQEVTPTDPVAAGRVLAEHPQSILAGSAAAVASLEEAYPGQFDFIPAGGRGKLYVARRRDAQASAEANSSSQRR